MWSVLTFFLFQNLQKKLTQDPSLVLDLDKLFHVRSVTQGDVIRADSKDIPKIFQVLYAGEGEARKPDENSAPGDDETKPGTINLKGHELLQISFHMPANCEACAKPLWHMFRPPPALECRRCRIKLHKDHLDRKEECIAPCKVNFYDSQSAKELLLMTATPQEQQNWVAKLTKKVQKGGFKAHRDMDLAQDRNSSLHSFLGNKSATLPPNSHLRPK